MSTAIAVEGLAKKYIINHRREPYLTLRDVISHKARELGRRILHPFRGGAEDAGSALETFWALKDVSFTVREGERLGIIGRNGAGKSTLLKVLSRITEPTEGRLLIRGHVASLLEVGTGFHPELTGRENIYLNGALLGMTRAEITRKFDDIVEFAEVERFLDTPVKRYSSGMYVRLAFAVAANLEPEILVVDEVLAVGDVQFQRKCLGRMEEVGRSGRTILFVSHNMAAIASLCTRAILLDGGRMVENGPTASVIAHYYGTSLAGAATVDFTRHPKPPGDSYAQLVSATVRNSRGEPAFEVDIREPVAVEMVFDVLRVDGLQFVPDYHFFGADGAAAFVSSDFARRIREPGRYRSTCMVPGNFLNDGTYFVGVALASFERGVQVHYYETNAVQFLVRDPLLDVPTRSGWGGRIEGVLRPLLEWRTNKVSEVGIDRT
jgi:lipopolysaccharide transport system ATP-binding protein